MDTVPIPYDASTLQVSQDQQVKDIRFDSYFDTVFGIWNMVYRYSIFLQGVDRYNKDSERPDTNVERSNTTPLLDDKTIKTPVASTSSEL
ncbi:hypothetical protein Tco_1204870 [Tanacetum coccineum]